MLLPMLLCSPPSSPTIRNQYLINLPQHTSPNHPIWNILDFLKFAPEHLLRISNGRELIVISENVQSQADKYLAKSVQRNSIVLAANYICPTKKGKIRASSKVWQAVGGF